MSANQEEQVFPYVKVDNALMEIFTVLRARQNEKMKCRLAYIRLVQCDFGERTQQIFKHSRVSFPIFKDIL